MPAGHVVRFVSAECRKWRVPNRRKTAARPAPLTGSPEEVAHKVQMLEHAHFAPVIEKLISEPHL